MNTIARSPVDVARANATPQKRMRFERRQSRGPKEFLDVAEALVNLATAEGFKDELERTCVGVWPEATFYYGGTHLRVMRTGDSWGDSFYVDTSDYRSSKQRGKDEH